MFCFVRIGNLYHKQFTRKIKFYKQSDVYELNKAYHPKYVTFRYLVHDLKYQPKCTLLITIFVLFCFRNVIFKT
jgi:hypothetical protein